MAEKTQEVVVVKSVGLRMKEDLKEVGGEQAWVGDCLEASGCLEGFVAAPYLKVEEGAKGEALALRLVEVQ